VALAHRREHFGVSALFEVLDFDEQAGRLGDVSSVLAVTCLFALQQLQVAPRPTQVGAEVVVTASSGGQRVAGVAVEVELPDGQRRRAGQTDADGSLRFRPEVTGLHAFVAKIDEVRCVAPVTVAPARRRWLLALASVPLGLVLLALHLRRATARSAATS